jgi:hypothetical protein
MTMTIRHIAVLKAIQRNQSNPHPELMTDLRKLKMVIGHNAGSGYSITIRGIHAIDKANKQPSEN